MIHEVGSRWWCGRPRGFELQAASALNEPARIDFVCARVYVSSASNNGNRAGFNFFPEIPIADPNRLFQTTFSNERDTDYTFLFRSKKKYTEPRAFRANESFR